MTVSQVVEALKTFSTAEPKNDNILLTLLTTDRPDETIRCCDGAISFRELIRRLKLQVEMELRKYVSALSTPLISPAESPLSM